MIKEKLRAQILGGSLQDYKINPLQNSKKLQINI